MDDIERQNNLEIVRFLYSQFCKSLKHGVYSNPKEIIAIQKNFEYLENFFIDMKNKKNKK